MITRAITLVAQRPANVYFVTDETAAPQCLARERQRLVDELTRRQRPR